MKFKIVFGIGNPGPSFAHTYHNVGLLALASWIEKEARFKKHGSFALHKKNGTYYAKSLRFMNESGIAVREALQFLHLHPYELLVVHDDSDLPLGSLKLSKNRGSAGHKGVASVIKELGTKEFARLRIGIRPPREASRTKASAFVLAHLRKEDYKLLSGAFERALKLTENVIESI